MTSDSGLGQATGAFSSALKSFRGHLEGTSKAAHTIDSYRSDLNCFTRFLKKWNPDAPYDLKDLSLEAFNEYQDYLKKLGLKINTRRRRLLTVRKFIRYLNLRKKINLDVSRQIVAPYKIERIPQSVSIRALLSKIMELPAGSELQARNRLLLWVLSETGAQVSEIGKLTWEDLTWIEGQGGVLQVPGKLPRAIPVSQALFDSIQSWLAQSSERHIHRKKSFSMKPYLFLGFNKFGPLGGAISPRGVELLVREIGPVLGFPNLTPRLIRHSVVLGWFELGIPQPEIQRRLGLKTGYAFRGYSMKIKKVTEV